MTVVSDITVRALSDRDDAAVLRLLTETMAGGPTGERSQEFFDWKHRRNPFGASIALVAEQDGDLVGLRTFMRWRFRRDQQTVTAVRAVDTATHPRAQGRGIFTRLTRAALEIASADTDLVFNTPNANSLPGYLKMGWEPVGQLPITVGVGRPLRFLRGMGAAGGGDPGGPPPACTLPPVAEALADERAVTALLAARTPRTGRVRTDTGTEYLRWRYVDAPALDYRAVSLRSGTDLVGLAIGRPRRRGSLAELTLSEVLVPEGDTTAARALLRAVRRCGVDHVSSHNSGDPTVERAGFTAGYVRVPGRGMTLVANRLSEAAGSVTSLGDWALSLGDLEVF